MGKTIVNAVTPSSGGRSLRRINGLALIMSAKGLMRPLTYLMDRETCTF